MKKLLYTLLVLLIVVIGGYFYLLQDFTKTYRLIIYNGPIITMEDSLTTPEAIYVQDGVIQAIGNKAEILKLKDAHTKIIDLQGKTLLPGFIDPHTHPLISALLLNMEDLSGFTHQTPQQVWQHLSRAVKKYAPGEWVICKGLDPILTKGLVSPHISLLDSLAPQNPVLIFSQTLHNYWANSLAFKEVGVTENTKAPSSTSYYEKDNNGKLTGLILEQAALKPFRERMLKEVGQKQLIKALSKVMDNYAQAGNTSIASLGLTTDKANIMKLFQHLSGQKPSIFGQALATVGMFPSRKPQLRHFVYIRHDALNLLPDSPQNGDDFFKVLGVKYWYDGSPIAGSMYMSKPYEVSKLTQESIRIKPGHTGEHLISPEKMKSYITQFQKKGWQMAIHAHGDQAINDILDAFEYIHKTQDVTQFRHRLEHCLLLNEDNIKRMQTLNMTPSLHINFIYYYGDALKKDILGTQRIEKILQVKNAFSNKLSPSLHADQPMYASEPFSLISTAVNRMTKEGYLIGAHQKISVWQALQALTINAAWQLHMEDKIGSIKKGKYADFVILDKNPLSITKGQLRGVQVLQTIAHGNTVYKK